jgi:hypothetical protein
MQIFCIIKTAKTFLPQLLSPQNADDLIHTFPPFSVGFTSTTPSTMFSLQPPNAGYKSALSSKD